MSCYLFLQNNQRHTNIFMQWGLGSIAYSRCLEAASLSLQLSSDLSLPLCAWAFLESTPPAESFGGTILP